MWIIGKWYNFGILAQKKVTVELINNDDATKFVKHLNRLHITLNWKLNV